MYNKVVVKTHRCILFYWGEGKAKPGNVQALLQALLLATTLGSAQENKGDAKI